MVVGRNSQKGNADTHLWQKPPYPPAQGMLECLSMSKGLPESPEPLFNDVVASRERAACVLTEMSQGCVRPGSLLPHRELEPVWLTGGDARLRDSCSSDDGYPVNHGPITVDANPGDCCRPQRHRSPPPTPATSVPMSCLTIPPACARWDSSERKIGVQALQTGPISPSSRHAISSVCTAELARIWPLIASRTSFAWLTTRCPTASRAQ